MFRQKKIHKFVEKYGWELVDNDFDKLEIFLNQISNFTSIIRRINKLSKMDQEYVVSSINNCNKYHFNEEELELILNTKLNYIKKNSKKGFKHIDFDHIYYAFKPNAEFFKYYIMEYQESKQDSSSSINLGSYYDAINKHYKQFNKVFKRVVESSNYEVLNKYIYALPPRFLCSFFEETKEQRISINIQRKFFDYISNSERMFDKLSMSDFRDILEFIFKCDDQANERDLLDKKLLIVKEFKDELKNDWCFLNALGNLTDNYILGIFKEDSITYDMNFLSLLKEVDNHTKGVISDFIRNVNSHYNDDYYKILNSDLFTRLGDSTIELILKEIEKVKDEETDYRIEIINCIMSCAILDDENVIKKALEFIEEDNDIKLISTKITCIKNIIPHMYNEEVSYEGYIRYLDLLNDHLEGKTIEEKIDILETKANFIEKRKVYKNVDKISKKAMRLLNDEENRNKDIYSFISNTSSNYNNSVVEKIVDGLSNLRNNKDKEAFINFVVDEFFVLSNKKRQETLLELFDDKKVAVDFSENKEETISVSPYVHSIVNNSDRPMEFVNKDTGLKIFVKTAKKD